RRGSGWSWYPAQGHLKSSVSHGFLCDPGGGKNPREGSAEEISFPWDLRYGHGVGGSGVEGAWLQGHWVGRKCLSADVDVSRRKGHLVERRVSRGKPPGRCGCRGDRQRDEAWESGSGSGAEQKASLPFVAGSAEKLLSARSS